jgi:hypothetical protein
VLRNELLTVEEDSVVVVELSDEEELVEEVSEAVDESLVDDSNALVVADDEEIDGPDDVVSAGRSLLSRASVAKTSLKRSIWLVAHGFVEQCRCE